MITPALVLPDGWSLFWQSSSIKALHHGGQLSLSRIPPPDQFAIVTNLRTQDHFLASLCNLCTGSLNFVSGNCSNFWKAWKDVRSKWEKHSLHWGHLQDQMSPVLVVNVCFCQCEREMGSICGESFLNHNCSAADTSALALCNGGGGGSEWTKTSGRRRHPLSCQSATDRPPVNISFLKISFDRQPAVKITPVTVLVVILVNCPLKISKGDSRERWPTKERCDIGILWNWKKWDKNKFPCILHIARCESGNQSYGEVREVLWAPRFLQTSWREQSTMHVR